MGRFLSNKDMIAAKRKHEIFNSMLKRGEVRAADKIVREHHVVCGCGAEGCMFIHATRDETEEERDQSITEYNKNQF